MSASEADFGVEISKGVLAKFVMAAIGFAGAIIFARDLGPGGYGSFYVVLTLVNVLDNPVTGWGVACKKRISESDFPTSEALGSGLIGAIVLPFVILPAVYIVNRFLEPNGLSEILLPFSVLFIILGFFKITNRVLSARSNFSSAEWADTLRSLFTTPLQLVFVVLLGFGATGMVYGVAVATALTVPYILYRIGVKPARPSQESLSSIASYAKFSIPNGFIGTTKSRIDILLLWALISRSAVGKYQVSMQLTMAGTFIGGVASMGLMARVSEYWSQDDSTAIVNDVRNAVSYASILTIPIFFGTAAMPNDLLVTVFGSEYSGTGAVLVGLALYRAIAQQSSQLKSTIGGLNRPDINTRIGFLVLVLNIGLGYVLLLEYGIIGVVIATVVSEVFQYAILSYIIKQQLSEVTLFARPLQHQLFAGAAMFLVVDRLHTVFGVSWWGDLAALISVGSLVYFFLLVAVSKQFRVTIRGILIDVAT